MSKDEKKALATVKEYMLAQNRPYGVTDVHTNLRSEFGKAIVQRALDTLVAKGDLSEKAIGKSKLYYANQDKLPAPDPNEVAELDAQVAKVDEELREKQKELKKLESELTALTGGISVEQMKERIQELEKENASIEERLVTLRDAGQQVSVEDMQAAEKLRSSALKAWKTRKRAASDMFDAIRESCSKKAKELRDDIGIETDEEAKVKMPS